MIFLFCHIAIALIATWVLFRYPYLKLTNLGWILGIWFIPILGAGFFLLTVVGSVSKGRSANFEKLRQSSDLPKRIFSTSLNKDKYDSSAHIEQEQADVADNEVVTQVDIESQASADSNVSCSTSIDALNHLGEQLGYLPYFCLDNFSVYHDEEFVPAVFEALRQAKKRIWVSTYILQGNVKQEFLEILQEAHDRGVDVRLVVDRHGSEMMFLSKAKELWLKHYSFPIFVFRDSTLKSYLYIEKRLHSKMILIDENTAFIGSHNLRDETVERKKDFAHNVSLKISGSIVDQLSAVFADLWFYNVKKDDRVLELQDSLSNVCEPKSSDDQPYPARIIFSEPLARSGIFEQYFTALLLSARKNIYIWSPYVIPSRAMRQILIASKRLGVDVKVLVPEKTDSTMVDMSHRLVLKEFSDAGIPCVKMPGYFDHTKIYIIDDLLLLGSANFDYRSLYRNYEANLEIVDADYVNEWKRTFIARFDSQPTLVNYRNSHASRIYSHLISLVAGLY